MRAMLIASALLGVMPCLAASGDIPATRGAGSLRVGCAGVSLFVSPAIVPAARVGVSYQFDTGPAVPRFAGLAASGAELWPWPAEGASALRGHKRLRVTVFPLGEPERTLEFDVTDAPRLNCR